MQSVASAAQTGEQASSTGFKVAVLGAAGGIGQPLSLLMNMQPLVGELALYDVANTKGVAADLGHCNTPVAVTSHEGEASLASALDNAHLVIIPAGVPRKPGMSRDDLFNINAGIVRTLVEAAATYCPEALIGVVTNPVNSTVPIAAEVLKEAGTYQPNRLFGVSTLDVVRANTFVSELKGVNVAEVDVPVVGGHSGTTILPLFSQTTPSLNFTQEEIEGLTNRTQNAGTEVVEAKEGAGSATLSMAYAAARFVESCLRGLSGEKDVVECSYVPTNAVEGMNFFASKVLLGPNGAEEVYGLGELSEYEASLLPGVKEELDGNIQKGIDWAQAELSGANKQQEAASSQ